MASRKEYFKQYQQKNKEKLKAYSREKYIKDKATRLLYQEKYYVKNRTNMLTANKIRTKANRELILKAKDKPCMDCGIAYPSYVMQFDHRDPKTKRNNLGQMLGCSTETILIEIAKCDVVCSNCHAERTWRR